VEGEERRRIVQDEESASAVTAETAEDAMWWIVKCIDAEL
jgi:hypothetical protein